ncbi:MAG: IS30 family transposase [Acidimicrobiia bacterium]|nr:IS30 family transposase [Acidimicrobiia bacterium]
MPGAPLSLPEREEIALALIEDRTVAWAVIARRVDRHPTTISREVTLNGGRYRYRPAVAQRAGDMARRRHRPRRLQADGPLRDRVTAELRLGRSPVAIWADLVADDVTGRVCAESIYAAVYAGALDVSPTECLRSRRPRRRRRQARHPSTRPALPNIAARPAAVGDRSEAGHWEADQIIGARNQSSMLWLTERVSRYSIPVTMPEGYNAEAMLGGLVEGLDRIPPHLLRSITFDQGSEWAQWPTIAATYGIDAWFCDPHSPWQRGQIENLNRQWRWWFPRGMRLDNVDPAHADHVAGVINGQRRRSLDYHSPAALYAALTVH